MRDQYLVVVFGPNPIEQLHTALPDREGCEYCFVEGGIYAASFAATQHIKFPDMERHDDLDDEGESVRGWHYRLAASDIDTARMKMLDLERSRTLYRFLRKRYPSDTAEARALKREVYGVAEDMSVDAHAQSNPSLKPRLIVCAGSVLDAGRSIYSVIDDTAEDCIVTAINVGEIDSE